MSKTEKRLWIANVILGALAFFLAIAIFGCAMGRNWFLFPQDSNGYHFNPCLYPEKVKPKDREWYNTTCP